MKVTQLAWGGQGTYDVTCSLSIMWVLGTQNSGHQVLSKTDTAVHHRYTHTHKHKLHNCMHIHTHHICAPPHMLASHTWYMCMCSHIHTYKTRTYIYICVICVYVHTAYILWILRSHANVAPVIPFVPWEATHIFEHDSLPFSSKKTDCQHSFPHPSFPLLLPSLG